MEHRFTLSSMHSVGVELHKLNRHKESYEMHTQTLELRRKVLGAEHVDTLSSMH